MKRQSKPFAVEIKRSRRSPGASTAVSPEGARHEPDEQVFLEKPANSPAREIDLIVPAFLQQDKGFRPPASKVSTQEALQGFFKEEAFRDKDKVFGSPVSRDSNPRPSNGGAGSRILPSLELIEPEPHAQSARPVRGRKPRSPDAPKKETPRRGTDAARGLPALSAEADVGSSRENAPRQKSAGTARSVLVKQRGAGASGGLRTKKASKPADAVVTVPNLAANSAHPDLQPRPVRVRSFLKRGKDDAAALPPGQRWKRRIHPSAW